MEKIKCVLILICFSLMAADYENKNRPNFFHNRTGITQQNGNQIITKRSDGSESITKPYGENRTITIEKSKNGKAITGITQQQGKQTVTKWSNGSTTTSKKIGNHTIVTENQKNGKSISGTVSNQGKSSITRWNNGSTNTNRKIGNTTINTDRH